MQETSLLNVYNPQQVLAESLLQNIPNWRTVVQALPPQGCLLVTRLENQQCNPEIYPIRMTVIEAKRIVKSYFEKLGLDHKDNQVLKIGANNYRIIPDDVFIADAFLYLIEYENTKRPVESISKYWWLLQNTNWLDNNLPIKLLFIGLNETHDGIRSESVQILGQELSIKYPNLFSFFYLPWNGVSESSLQALLGKITEL